MNTSTTTVAKLITTVLESIANENVGVEDALSQIKHLLTENVDFSNVTALWQLANMSNDILAAIIPEKSGVFVAHGDRQGPIGDSRIDSTTGVLIVIRVVMRGLELFDSNNERRCGASAILAFCPNPIERSAEPFADKGDLWRHRKTIE
jgi:hypothetical protein